MHISKWTSKPIFVRGMFPKSIEIGGTYWKGKIFRIISKDNFDPNFNFGYTFMIQYTFAINKRIQIETFKIMAFQL